MTRVELETNDSTISIETIGSVDIDSNGRKSIEIQFTIEQEGERIVAEWYMSDVIPMQDYAQCPTLWDYFQTQLPHIPLQFV